MNTVYYNSTVTAEKDKDVVIVIVGSSHDETYDIRDLFDCACVPKEPHYCEDESSDWFKCVRCSDDIKHRLRKEKNITIFQLPNTYG